jgi:hypothetical protein
MSSSSPPDLKALIAAAKAAFQAKKLADAAVTALPVGDPTLPTLQAAAATAQVTLTSANAAVDAEQKAQAAAAAPPPPKIPIDNEKNIILKGLSSQGNNIINTIDKDKQGNSVKVEKLVVLSNKAKKGTRIIEFIKHIIDHSKQTPQTKIASGNIYYIPKNIYSEIESEYGDVMLDISNITTSDTDGIKLITYNNIFNSYNGNPVVLTNTSSLSPQPQAPLVPSGLTPQQITFITQIRDDLQDMKKQTVTYNAVHFTTTIVTGGIKTDYAKYIKDFTIAYDTYIDAVIAYDNDNGVTPALIKTKDDKEKKIITLKNDLNRFLQFNDFKDNYIENDNILLKDLHAKYNEFILIIGSYLGDQSGAKHSEVNKKITKLTNILPVLKQKIDGLITKHETNISLTKQKLVISDFKTAVAIAPLAPAGPPPTLAPALGEISLTAQILAKGAALSGLTSLQLTDLKPEEVTALDPPKFLGLTLKQLSTLNPQTLATLTSTQIEGLPAPTGTAFTLAQIGGLIPADIAQLVVSPSLVQKLVDPLNLGAIATAAAGAARSELEILSPEEIESILAVPTLGLAAVREAVLRAARAPPPQPLPVTALLTKLQLPTKGTKLTPTRAIARVVLNIANIAAPGRVAAVATSLLQAAEVLSQSQVEALLKELTKPEVEELIIEIIKPVAPRVPPPSQSAVSTVLSAALTSPLLKLVGVTTLQPPTKLKVLTLKELQIKLLTPAAQVVVLATTPPLLAPPRVLTSSEAKLLEKALVSELVKLRPVVSLEDVTEAFTALLTAPAPAPAPPPSAAEITAAELAVNTAVTNAFPAPPPPAPPPPAAAAAVAALVALAARVISLNDELTLAIEQQTINDNIYHFFEIDILKNNFNEIKKVLEVISLPSVDIDHYWTNFKTTTIDSNYDTTNIDSLFNDLFIKIFNIYFNCDVGGKTVTEKEHWVKIREINNRKNKYIELTKINSNFSKIKTKFIKKNEDIYKLIFKIFKTFMNYMRNNEPKFIPKKITEITKHSTTAGINPTNLEANFVLNETFITAFMSNNGISFTTNEILFIDTFNNNVNKLKAHLKPALEDLITKFIELTKSIDELNNYFNPIINTTNIYMKSDLVNDIKIIDGNMTSSASSINTDETEIDNILTKQIGTEKENIGKALTDYTDTIIGNVNKVITNKAAPII